MFVRDLCGQPHPVFQDSASSSLPAPLYWRRAGRRRAALVGAQAFNLTNKAGQRMGHHCAGLFFVTTDMISRGVETGATPVPWFSERRRRGRDSPTRVSRLPSTQYSSSAGLQNRRQPNAIHRVIVKRLKSETSGRSFGAAFLLGEGVSIALALFFLAGERRGHSLC